MSEEAVSIGLPTAAYSLVEPHEVGGRAEKMESGDKP